MTKISKEYIIEQLGLGISQVDIAKQLGVPKHKLRKFGVGSKKYKWTTYNNKDWIVDQHKKGLTNKKIAENLGVTQQLIGKWCRELGIVVDESRKRDNRDVTYYEYKCAANRRGIDWKLCKNDFFQKIILNCEYCNNVNTNTTYLDVKRRSENLQVFSYTGIDRIDSSLGYTKENTVPCCKICNIMKNELSLEEFKIHILTIVKNKKWHLNQASIN